MRLLGLIVSMFLLSLSSRALFADSSFPKNTNTRVTVNKQKPAESETRKNVRELLLLTAASSLSERMIDKMIQGMKMQFPKADQAFWDDFKRSADLKGLIEKLIPVYEKNLKPADVKALLAFFHTPLGKRYLQAAPNIQEESAAIGDEWGSNLYQTAQAKYEAFLKKHGEANPGSLSQPPVGAPEENPSTPIK